MPTRACLALALALSLTACAHAPAGPAAPPVADDATLIAMSHDFLDAWDGPDQARLGKLLAPDFARYRAMRLYPRQWTLEGRARRWQGGKTPPRRTLTYADEKVRRFGATAIYTAQLHEEVEGSPPEDVFVTLVWTQGGQGWQVAHLATETYSLETERAMWNEAFRNATGFNTAPNRFLMKTVTGRKPGRALDVGVGMGRNALYLASQGWQVTGVDIADEGLRQAREVADQQGLELELVNADVDTWDWGQERWDLIAMIYMGGRDHVERIKRALAPGGIVVFEYFAAESTQGVGVNGFKPGELATLFAGFTVLHDEVVEDMADYGLRPMKLVRFVAQKPTR
jgi:SAM-dependent methyltransferase